MLKMTFKIVIFAQKISGFGQDMKYLIILNYLSIKRRKMVLLT
jgi:hypothetical protein